MDAFDNTIKDLIATQKELALEAKKGYLPIVAAIIEDKSKDIHKIEGSVN